MAPEQAAGDSAGLTPATDVFGLSGILYWVLYGVAPNQGDSAWEMMAAAAKPKQPGRLREGILPRGRRVPHNLASAIAGLQEICLKGLQPCPSDRYADVNQLLVEVNEWLAETAEVH